MYLFGPFVGAYVDEHHGQHHPHRVEARKRLQHRDEDDRHNLVRPVHLEVDKTMSG